MGEILGLLPMNPLTAGIAGLFGLAVTIAIIVGIAMVIRSNFPRLWRLILQAVNLIPAGILAIVGVFAIPLWWLMNRLVGMLLKIAPVDSGVAHLLEKGGPFGA